MENKNNLAVLCSFDLLCIHQLHVRGSQSEALPRKMVQHFRKTRGSLPERNHFLDMGELILLSNCKP